MNKFILEESEIYLQSSFVCIYENTANITLEKYNLLRWDALMS